MSEWNIKAIVRGDIYGDRSINLQYVDMGQGYWHPSTFYYLTDGDQHVLIDTGYGDPEEITETQPLFELRAERPFEQLLREEAVPPEEVDLVVMSHLHWDHAGNVDAFPDDVEIMINRRAAEFAYAPPEPFAGAFLSPTHGYDPPWTSTSFTFFDGDTTIAEGIRAVHTPGHTPGHVSFLVEHAGTTYGLAIDVFPTYENIEGVGDTRYHPPGCVDALAWWESAHRMDTAADVLIPSHDPDGPANEWIVGGES